MLRVNGSFSHPKCVKPCRDSPPPAFIHHSNFLFSSNKKLERCIKDTRGIKKRIAERRIK